MKGIGYGWLMEQCYALSDNDCEVDQHLAGVHIVLGLHLVQRKPIKGILIGAQSGVFRRIVYTALKLLGQYKKKKRKWHFFS